MKKKIYTVGHSTHTIEKFLDLLVKYDINCVADVRSVPFSKYAPQFNELELKFVLAQKTIRYVGMSKEFGARREEANLYIDGKLDFVKTAKSEVFLEGMDRILEGIDKGFRIALMCTEKNPADCHRCILVGRAFSEAGLNVQNILEDGELKSQNDIEQCLLDEYYPTRMQMEIGKTIISNEEYIAMAYERRAREIAYEMGGSEG